MKSNLLLFSLLFFSILFVSYHFKQTASYFFDTASLTGNAFTINVWTTPVSTPPITVREVIINEVMWMGSSLSSADEWIELKNTKSFAIDLTGWTIEQAGTFPNETIILMGSIPANGYFLITNYQTNHANAAVKNSINSDLVVNLSLDNGGEELVLKDRNGTVIDSTPTGNWPAGINTSLLKQSMERKNPPGNGADNINWVTCNFPSCNNGNYWDTAGGQNYGTPKHDNLYE